MQNVMRIMHLSRKDLHDGMKHIQRAMSLIYSVTTIKQGVTERTQGAMRVMQSAI